MTFRVIRNEMESPAGMWVAEVPLGFWRYLGLRLRIPAVVRGIDEELHRATLLGILRHRDITPNEALTSEELERACHATTEFSDLIWANSKRNEKEAQDDSD